VDPRSRYDDICDALTAWHPDARTSKVFGMPCVKRSGRVVFGLSRTGMVFKLTDPTDHARALAVPGAHLFDPSGRGHVRETSRGNLPVPVPPDPLHSSADADKRLRRREELAYTALAQDHSPGPA
jgi:hypothetical protein